MAFLIGTYIISFYFQNNNLWSHFSDNISFIDENLTKVMHLKIERLKIWTQVVEFQSPCF